MTINSNDPLLEVRSTAVVTKFLHRMFSNSGLDADEVFRLADINFSEVEDPDYRVPHRKLLDMWRIAGEISENPEFGLSLSELAPAAPFNAAGYLAMTSNNLRMMLKVFQKYFRIFTDRGTFSLKETDSVAIVSIDLTGGLETNRQHSDFWQAFFYRTIKYNIGWELPLLEAGFRHSKPENAEGYERAFKADIKFNQEVNYLKFSSVYLDYEILGADTAMRKFHEQQANQKLSALTEVGLVNKVKLVVFEMLPDNNVDLTYVASKLNLTTRTVQRNLANEGTTFKRILDEARKEHTISEIRDTHYSISEVAYRLGYRDLSSFYRAFKRWTGLTPVEYRDVLKNGADGD